MFVLQLYRTLERKRERDTISPVAIVAVGISVVISAVAVISAVDVADRVQVVTDLAPLTLEVPVGAKVTQLIFYLIADIENPASLIPAAVQVTAITVSVLETIRRTSEVVRKIFQSADVSAAVVPPAVAVISPSAVAVVAPPIVTVVATVFRTVRSILKVSCTILQVLDRTPQVAIISVVAITPISITAVSITAVAARIVLGRRDRRQC